MLLELQSTFEAQSADILYITHSSHEVSKLSRTGHTSWTLSEVDFTDGPYLDTNTTATTMTPGSAGVGTGVTLTARGALIYNTSSAVTNAAVAVLDFGGNKTATAGTFTIQFPAFTTSAAILRIS